MNWFKNQKTFTKVMLGFGALAALMGFVGYQGMSGMSKVNVMLDETYNKEMAGLAAIRGVHIQVVELSAIARQSIIDTDAAAFQADQEEYRSVSSDLTQKLATAEALFYKPAGKVAIAEIKKSLADYSAEVQEIIRLRQQNQSDAALQMLKKAKSDRGHVVEAIDRASTIKENTANDFFRQSQAAYASVRQIVIFVIVAGIIAAIVIGYFISQLIARPLAQMVATAKELAAGRLDQKVEHRSKDEVGELADAFRTMILEFSAAVNETAEMLGRLAHRDLTARMTGNAKGDFQRIEKSLNAAAENLEQALDEVRSSSEQVALTAEQLSSASQEISTGAQEQSSSLEETSATLEEITSTVKQNADNARQANQLAAGAREAAENGGKVMSSAVSAMGEINTASSRIADIITTIDEIAFQTNLLALNAAVEAARAGEQGRGFAVVASEVRSLAQRSASAAKEIKGLIQDSLRKVENGSDLVNNSGRTLNELVASVKRVTDIVAEIAAASQEQATGVEQVAKAMAQMDQVTQANSAQTEEMSSTAEELSATASNLQDLVGQFKIKTTQSFSSAGTGSPKKTRSKVTIAKRKTAPVRDSQSDLAALALETNGDGFEPF